MGAWTSVLFAGKTKTEIHGLILDSWFDSFKVISKYLIPLPDILYEGLY